MRLIDKSEHAVTRAALDDLVRFEGGEYVVNDDRAAVVRVGELNKCLLADAREFNATVERLNLRGEFCLFGASKSAPTVIGFCAEPCITYAYFGALPQPLSGIATIKRLGTSMADAVAATYENKNGHYTSEHVRDIIINKGVFGAFKDSGFAGFVGRHDDGTMGLLHVFEPFRKRGFGAELEKFIIGYVMTFGRVPLCDVYADNPVSLDMQSKLGLTPAADGYTYWFKR